MTKIVELKMRIRVQCHTKRQIRSAIEDLKGAIRGTSSGCLEHSAAVIGFKMDKP